MKSQIRPLNLNHLAKCITEQEGGKLSLPIGQVKEVQRLLLEELAYLDPIVLLLTLAKVREKIRKGAAARPPAPATTC